jgi:hypothetical protein
VLHAVVTHCGLQDSGELLAMATPEQLAAVFDLDLWKADRAGADEQFDAARFCEWLDVLVDVSPSIAADKLARLDVTLIISDRRTARGNRDCSRRRIRRSASAAPR